MSILFFYLVNNRFLKLSKTTRINSGSSSDFVQLQFVEERDKSILISGEFTVAFLSKTAYNVSRNILLLSTVTERVLSMPITK